MTGRRGFSLIEVTIGLVLASMALATAHALVAATTTLTMSLRDAAEQQSVAGAGRRWLQTALASASVGRPEDGPFHGTAGTIEFTGFLPVSEGWHMRQRLQLGISRDSLRLHAGRWSVVLAPDVSGVEFDYLLEPGEASVWVREWSSSVSLPLAVRIRLRRGQRTDTMLALIGQRG